MTKAESKYLALLRGINVGGNNIIAKDDLRRCFEDLGFRSVKTYIQSGNVLFRTGQTTARTLTGQIEAGLSVRFDYAAQAVVLSQRRYRSAVKAAPDDWGVAPDFKHNALFLLTGTTPQQVLSRLQDPPTKFEKVTIGPGVIFWSVSKANATKSTLMRLASLSIYKKMTVRNHNTVHKLLQLFDEI